MEPYIGITGFMSAREVYEVLASVDREKLGRRKIMVGVLVSPKTLSGTPNKWPNRFPQITDIGRVFLGETIALNLIHYSTDEPETLDEQLRKFSEILQCNLDGFQLNIVWPDPKLLEKYLKNDHNWWRRIRMVLWVGTKAFQETGNDPYELAKRLANYRGYITDVLLDFSGGYGQLLNPEQLREYLVVLREFDSYLGLGVAGGLSAETVDLVRPLLEDFPLLSVDAEGRLRDESDNLVLSRAKDYVAKALEVINNT